ncbi:hypothetical protein SLEP1_g37951 [Rubroshorea leprosula]|uniref:Uncharacterized protein n=1 Tax=Rubroshorea leprosula TaxID=152421 RepID=A0AAV5KWA5_9ROSI|nr:hypothetical protein SLEP1_g37951 [Rubroshorea leprosula]
MACSHRKSPVSSNIWPAATSGSSASNISDCRPIAFYFSGNLGPSSSSSSDHGFYFFSYSSEPPSKVYLG